MSSSRKISSLLSLLSISSLVSAGTFSLTDFPAFSVQRNCVRYCMSYQVPYSLSCKSPYSDNCVCRTDLASTASFIINDCVTSNCPDAPADVTSADQLYDNYCATKLDRLEIFSTFSMTTLQGYSDLRKCGQYCMSYGLASDLGCYVSGTVFDQCMCKTDAAKGAASYLTSCVSEQCSGVVADIESAVGAYGAYCGGSMTEAAATAAATTAAAFGATTAVGASSGNRATVTSAQKTASGATSTSSSTAAASSSSKSGLGTGAIIGIVVSVLGTLIGTAVTVYFRYIRHKKKMEVLENQTKADVSLDNVSHTNKPEQPQWGPPAGTR